jgi:hypothetical protein
VFLASIIEIFIDENIPHQGIAFRVKMLFVVNNPVGNVLKGSSKVSIATIQKIHIAFSIDND